MSQKLKLSATFCCKRWQQIIAICSYTPTILLVNRGGGQIEKSSPTCRGSTLMESPMQGPRGGFLRTQTLAKDMQIRLFPGSRIQNGGPTAAWKYKTVRYLRNLPRVSPGFLPFSPDSSPGCNTLDRSYTLCTE